jgi:ribonuclease H-related protein
MPVKCEQELRERAEALVSVLLEQNIDAALDAGSFRDYQVKVALGSLGKLVLYYSPKKQAHSYKTHELKRAPEATLAAIQRCWQRIEAPLEDGNQPEGYRAYVDGSYMDDAIGYGWVLIADGKIVAEESGPVTDGKLQGMRQIGGELKGVLSVIDWCEAHNIDEVTIYYDYEGLEAWATGRYKGGNPATAAYAQAAQHWPVAVNWEKVKSHSGDHWNDYVDRLAKQGTANTESAEESELSPIELVSQKAMAFVSFAADAGLRLNFDGIKNEQYGRVVIVGHPGYVDIYNTRKRSLDRPYAHGFRDPELQEQVLASWRSFLGDTEPDEDNTADLQIPGPLNEVTHYYRILQPYRDCAFDFVALARAIEDACEQHSIPCPEADGLRYDFAALEGLYHKLQRRMS